MLSPRSMFRIILYRVLSPMASVSIPIITVTANTMRTASMSEVIYAMISPALCSWKKPADRVCRWEYRSLRMSRSIFRAEPKMNQRQAMRPRKTMSAMTASRRTVCHTRAAVKPCSAMKSMVPPTTRGTSVWTTSMKISTAMPMR